MPVVFKRRTKPKDITDDTIPNVQTGAHLRIQRDFASLELPDNVKIIRKEDEWLEFSMVFNVQDGFWKNGIFQFLFNISTKYPFEGPKVICIDKIYHPNIDLEGKICVSTLRPWKPTSTIEQIMFALIFLFNCPNPNDPLNTEAASIMRTDIKEFTKYVQQSLMGGYVGETFFPKNKGFE